MRSLQIFRQNRCQIQLCVWLAVLALFSVLNFWIALLTDLYQNAMGGGWDSPVLIALISLGLALLFSFMGVMVYIKSWFAWIVFVLVLINTLLLAIFVINFRWTM